MNTATNNNQTADKKNTIVCTCCLAFFPVLYLIGSTVMTIVS